MFNIEKYKKIEESIKKLGNSTKIIAISKNHPLSLVQEAVSNGVLVFGENRVQEAEKKFENIKKEQNKINLHLTGPLQTNKVRQALNIFDTFHTLDREKLLKEISKYQDLIKNKNFFIQINTGKELSKSGIYPEDAESFLKLCYSYGITNIQGLMCIPPINENPLKHFQLLENTSKELGLSGLSIGMSSDFEEALQYNPLYIRLGTALFGTRE